MRSTGLALILMCCLPFTGFSLRCYTCLFPIITPLECLKFPQNCSAGQRCLISRAVGVKGSVEVVLYERNCGEPAQCDQSGEKHVEGLDYKYNNQCCDTDLCNTAAHTGTLYWTGTSLILTGLVLLLQLT